MMKIAFYIQTRKYSHRAAKILSSNIIKHLPQSSESSEKSLFPRLKEILKLSTKRIIVINQSQQLDSTFNYDYLVDDSSTKLQDPLRHQDFNLFMQKQLVKNNEPIFISSYAAYTSEEEASIIVKEIIANIYSAALETKFLGQFQLISYLSPNVSINSHYSTIKSILLASPVWIYATFLIPSHIEKGYIVFDNTLYLNKKNLLKTESNIYQSLADTAVSAANKLVSITIEDIRVGGIHHVQNIIENLEEGSLVLVNAVNYHDLNIFTIAALQAESDIGKCYLYKGSESFINARLGIEPNMI